MSKREESVMPVGGQAVIEGVMMRVKGMVATAVRKSTGEVVVQRTPFVSISEELPLLKLPFLRGAVGLIEMMVIGIRTLNYSVGISLGMDETVTKESSSAAVGLTVALSLGIGVALFFATPLVITSALFDVDQQPLLFNTTAGIIRVLLLIGYMVGISFSKEIRRVFEYHGAEHKAVFAFEKGEGLTVEAAARQSRFHPRCGTSFLLVVMLSSILLFSIIDSLLIPLVGTLTLPVRLLTHLPLIPLVGGISYEILRASARQNETLAGRIVSAPGLWLQRITTREPDSGQLEVALIALRSALGEDHSQNSEPVSSGELVHA